MDSPRPPAWILTLALLRPPKINHAVPANAIAIPVLYRMVFIGLSGAFCSVARTWLQ